MKFHFFSQYSEDRALWSRQAYVQSTWLCLLSASRPEPAAAGCRACGGSRVGGGSGVGGGAAGWLEKLREAALDAGDEGATGESRAARDLAARDREFRIHP